MPLTSLLVSGRAGTRAEGRRPVRRALISPLRCPFLSPVTLGRARGLQRGSGFLRVGLVKCDRRLEEPGPGQRKLRPLQRRTSCWPVVTGSEPQGQGLSPLCRFSQTPQEVQLS